MLNVLLVSTVQQSDSAIHIHVTHPLFFGFPCHVGPQRALSRVPCVVQ